MLDIDGGGSLGGECGVVGIQGLDPGGERFGVEGGNVDKGGGGEPRVCSLESRVQGGTIGLGDKEQDWPNEYVGILH